MGCREASFRNTFGCKCCIDASLWTVDKLLILKVAYQLSIVAVQQASSADLS